MIKKTLYIILVIILSACSTNRQGDCVATADNDVAISTDIYKKEIANANCFWGRTFDELCRQDNNENICLSPLSAQFAMAMVANGAKGNTQKELCLAIGSDSTINDCYRGVLAKLNREKYCEINIANSIWINNKLRVKKSFIDTNKEFFNAEVNTIPFDNNATGKINVWCKENTNGKIESIIDKVEPHHMMFLINALYFKAPWSTPFNAKLTTKGNFTTEKSGVIEVDLMKQTFNTDYYIDDVVQMTVKPFKEGYDMLFILPRHGKEINEAIEHLATQYDSCINNMERYKVEFALPKFKNEYKVSLRNTLCDMGMEQAFGNKAEFGRISNAPLYIEDVIQKTFINVDEEGAEAAAVTAVSVGLLAMRDQTPKSTMILDRPFLYAIRDNSTGTILFMGKVGNPGK